MALNTDGSVHSVVYFVRNPEQVAGWYAEAFGAEPYRTSTDFVGLQMGSTILGFHRADTKSGIRGRSQVCYWSVADVSTAAKRLITHGARWHRRTIRIPEGGRICQLKDPFGNIIGLADRP